MSNLQNVTKHVRTFYIINKQRDMSESLKHPRLSYSVMMIVYYAPCGHMLTCIRHFKELITYVHVRIRTFAIQTKYTSREQFLILQIQLFNKR
jgi:hypothetical protein